jgi:hypothetical protein
MASFSNETIIRYASQERFERFLKAANHNQKTAFEFYKANVDLSQSFFPLLHHFEVFFRNSIHNHLADYFGDNNWIQNQALNSGLFSDKSLSKSHFYLKTKIIESQNKIKASPISAGQIIADQTLGFWTSLFQIHHFKLFKGSLMNCFKYRESGVGRKQISMQLDSIRYFRNRIYHNEPICFENNKICTNHCLTVQLQIYQTLDWMHPDLRKYIEEFDVTNQKLNLFKG